MCGVSNSKFSDQTTRIAGIAWGVHTPFRDYIQRMSDGQMHALRGAEKLETGETFFPIDDHLTTPGELRFTGGLQFVGHHGMLAVSIQDPWLRFTGDAATLTIIDPFEEGSRMRIVAVDLHDDGTGTTWLTEEGTDLFMGNYQADIAFDPIRIVWVGKA